MLRIEGIPGQAILHKEAYTRPDAVLFVVRHAGLQGLELLLHLLLMSVGCQGLFHFFRWNELLAALVVFCVLIIVLGFLLSLGALSRDAVGHAIPDLLQ